MPGDIWKALILSLLAHGGVVAGLLFLAPYMLPPRFSLPPAQIVHLVDLPSAGGSGGNGPVREPPSPKKPERPVEPPRAEKPPEPKPEKTVPPKRKDPVPQPQMALPPPKAKEVPKKEPPKREATKPQPREQRPAAQQKEPVQHPETIAKQEPRSTGGERNTGPGSGPGDGVALGTGGGSLSLDTGNFPFTYYLRQLTGRIEENWIRPEENLGRVVIYFRIKRDGTIVEPQIYQSSRSRAVDLLAAGAIKRSEPFPPLPIEYGGDYLGIYMCFGMGSLCPGQKEG